MTIKYPKRIKTFERDDRDALGDIVEGLSDVLSFAESLQLVERYGLSLKAIEKEDSVAWICTDPDGLFCAENWTPSGAVILWDIKRQEVYDEEKKPVLRIVTED